MIKFVQELILANKDSLLREFKEYDLCSTGAIRKEVFSKLLHKYVFRLTDEQVRNFGYITLFFFLSLALVISYFLRICKKIKNRT